MNWPSDPVCLADIPFIQVLAAHLGCSPTQAGTLSSATGWGNFSGCAGVAVSAPRRIGLVFAAGMIFASASLALTAVDSFGVCLVGLFMANAGGGLFGAMQAALAMQAVPPTQHGTAMGMLSLAIGGQVRMHAQHPSVPRLMRVFCFCGPKAVGTMLIGKVSEWLSPSNTMLLFAALGFTAQALFNGLLPDCARMLKAE